MSYNIITTNTTLTVGSEADTLNNSTVVLDVDTTSSAITITLPVLSTFTYPFGITYIVHDYAGTAATNNITIAAGSGNEINNAASVFLNEADAAMIINAVAPTDWQAASSVNGLQIVTATATSDGLTTGLVANGNSMVQVTSASSSNLVTLPPAVPGTTVWLRDGGTGYKLRTTAPATIGINGGTGSSVSSAIGANVFVIMRCDTTTSWIGLQYTTAGVQSAVAVAS